MTDDRELVGKAAKVMGWPTELFGEVLIIRPACQLQSYIWIENHNPNTMATLWNPLERIADAWMLVDRMRELNLHFVLGSAPSGQTTAWFVDQLWSLAKRQNEVPHQDDPACRGSWTSDSVPRAITLAAIAACEVMPVSSPAPGTGDPPRS